jgi:hypothetical protein
MCRFGALDARRQHAIAKLSRYARHMWAVNPDLLHFLPRDKASFLPYSVSWEGIRPAPPPLGKKLRILHAPTNREAKGTEIIVAALERLQSTHPGAIETCMVENMPHQNALELYRSADLVIDQVAIGWYGGFAVETMRMGKPVIARIAKEDLHFIPPAMAADVERTLINADQHNLYDVLARCVEDRQFLREKSQASIEYATRWHDPVYVAGLTKEKYETT